MDGRLIERYDPLLRNLLAWGLVEESPDGRYALREDVSERVAQLAEVSRGRVPTEVVYFGHACAVCGSKSLTRLREGRYVCDACRRADARAQVATPLPAPEPKQPRSVLHRARRIAS